MLRLSEDRAALIGPEGSLSIAADDETTRRLAMLVAGECCGLGATEAAAQFGFCRAYYYRLLQAFKSGGALALKPQKTGPKRHYRRTDEVVRQVIRHRFLDPDASAEVIAQKLVQDGWTISQRSVQRVITHYELQKKGSTHAALPPRRPPASKPIGPSARSAANPPMR